MKCPKCNYTSFDYLETCKHCGMDLRDVRSVLQIIAVSPEDLAPAAPSILPSEEVDLNEVTPPEENPFADMRPLAEDEEILDGLDFDVSFDDLVEPTSYADQKPAPEPKPPSPPDAVPAEDHTSGDTGEDELLDLDFGDLFEDKHT